MPPTTARDALRPHGGLRRAHRPPAGLPHLARISRLYAGRSSRYMLGQARISSGLTTIAVLPTWVRFQYPCFCPALRGRL